MDRQQLTQRALELLPEDKRISLNDAMIYWWVNPRKSGGYRLTTEGYNVFGDKLEFENWRIEAPANLRLLLELDKKLGAPYYVNSRKRELVLFGSRDAMMANLHGDIKRYLELLERRST